MAIETLFKGTMPYFQCLFKNGKPAIFCDFKFSTSIEAEVAELMAEVEARHPNIYIDANETTVDTVKQDPVAALRIKFREELLAEQAATAASGNSKDMGTSRQGPLEGIASSASILAAAAGSSSGGTLIAAAPSK